MVSETSLTDLNTPWRGLYPIHSSCRWAHRHDCRSLTSCQEWLLRPWSLPRTFSLQKWEGTESKQQPLEECISGWLWGGEEAVPQSSPCLVGGKTSRSCWLRSTSLKPHPLAFWDELWDSTPVKNTLFFKKNLLYDFKGPPKPQWFCATKLTNSKSCVKKPWQNKTDRNLGVFSSHLVTLFSDSSLT